MQSVYSTAAADWATGYSLGKSYPSAEMQSVDSTPVADWAAKNKSERKFEHFSQAFLTTQYKEEVNKKAQPYSYFLAMWSPIEIRK